MKAKKIGMSCVFFAILGIVLGGFWEINPTVSLDKIVLSYCETPFQDCTSFVDALFAFFPVYFINLKGFLLIFFFGFTLFSTIAPPMVVLYNGFLLGLSVTYFTLAFRGLPLQHPFWCYLVFLVTNLLSLLLLLLFCWKTMVFGFAFRQNGWNIRSRIFVQFMGNFLLFSGCLLVLVLLREILLLVF